MLLSFVIPVYNEQDSLKQLTDEIIANCAPHNYEIIFIDDGSQDHSFAIMEELACQDPNIKVVKFRRNFGKAAALQYGF
ncbi:MAG: glycosyltransferase, partial [Candidatus Cloacimonetes bacterium]|nr:glycosyltransferase [Candidatus Cloacimonadota bacterium]